MAPQLVDVVLVAGALLAVALLVVLVAVVRTAARFVRRVVRGMARAHRAGEWSLGRPIGATHTRAHVGRHRAVRGQPQVAPYLTSTNTPAT